MRFFAGIVLALAPFWVQALEVGERLAPWTLLDQHDQACSLSEETRILLVARSMDGARLVESALKTRPQGYLEARRAVFVADISRMPSLIARLFAVPAMRDYPYRVLLDRDARVASRFRAIRPRCCGSIWSRGSCAPGASSVMPVPWLRPSSR